MIVNKGFETIRDAVKATPDNIKAGDDNTPTTTPMNALVSERFDAGGSIGLADGSSVAKSVHTARLTTSDGNGYTFKEVGMFNSGGDMIMRETHADMPKDASFEILYVITMEVQNV